MSLSNFFRGFANTSLWWRLAWADMSQIYRRSIIGIFWITLSFLMFVGVKIFIFGALGTADISEFSLWVILGYAVWTFLAASINDGSNVFVTSRAWILGTNLPLSTFIAQNITRHLIGFFLVSLISVAAVFYFDWDQTMLTWTVVPAVFLLIINSMWVHIVFGLICARYRDVLHLIRAIMHVMFFLTPILYMPKQLGEKAAILDYNPFTHYLAIVREPVVNRVFPELSWIVVICITIIGWAAALVLLKTRARNVAFWI